MSAPSPDPTGDAPNRAATPSDEAVIRFLDVDGVRLRTSTRGTGPPLLIITGLGASLELAEPFEREIVARGRQAIGFDAPGVGESTGYRWPKRMPGVARTVERMLDELGHQQVDVDRGVAGRGHRPAARPPGAGSGPPARAGGHRARASSGWAASRLAAGHARAGHPPPLHLTRLLPQHRRRPVRRTGPHRSRRPAARLGRPVLPDAPAWAAISASSTRSASGPGSPG